MARRFQGLTAVLAVGASALAMGTADATPAHAAPVGWTVQLGGPGYESIAAVAATTANEVVYVGVADGDGGHDTGHRAGMVGVFDKNGNEKWGQLVGGTGVTEFVGVAVASNGDIYAVGWTDETLMGQTKVGTDHDALLVKYDKKGNPKWARTLATSATDRAYGVAVRGSAIYVTGVTGGNLNGQIGGTDGFLARFDTKGARKFLTQFGTTANDPYAGWAVAVAPNGKTIVVAGDTNGTYANESAVSGSDAVAIAFTDKGVEKWHDQWGNSSGGGAYGVVFGRDGFAYVTGYTDDGTSVQLVSNVYQATTGVLQNAIVYDFGLTSEKTYAWPTTITKKNEMIMGAYTSGAFPGQVNHGGNDAGYVKFPKNFAGIPQARQIGTTGDDDSGYNGTAVAMMPNGSLITAGGTRGSLFGFTNAGNDDLWIAVFPNP